MSLVGEQILLRIYLQPRVPTYQLVLQAAREEKLAGATVLRGIMGMGYHGIQRESAWSIVRHEPIILEIVDAGDAVAQFIQGPLARIMTNGMLTLERAAVMMYRHRQTTGVNEMSLAGALPALSTLPAIQPGGLMQKTENGTLLRVFIGESDVLANQPLYEAIVHKARELGLAGATVLRGSEGFGANSIVHKSNLLDMSSDLPIVIEMVDAEDKIKLLLPYLEQTVKEGMITMEQVMVLAYRHNPDDVRDGAP